MNLFVVRYQGDYCMKVQIVRASTIHEAEEMAERHMHEKDYFSYSITALHVEGEPGMIFEASYIE